MAVQPWEIQPEPAHPRPALELAAAPPSPSGHPFAALALVVALIAALGIPIARSTSSYPASGVPRSRPQPVTAIKELDSVSPVTKRSMPRSPEVVGGIAYVSCTHLWLAHPDGTHERKLLEMPGISSPAFAPGGRTIAFARSGLAGPEIWMTGADGSAARKVATITSEGRPVAADATALVWSPDGKYLAFALVDGHYDPWIDGSAIWRFDLAFGDFYAEGAGFPTPVWTEDRLVYPTMRAGERGFRADRYYRWARSYDRDVVPMGAAAVSDRWVANLSRAVVLRDRDGVRELVVKSIWNPKEINAFGPPDGHAFVREGQPSISQDGTRAFVDLVDEAGQRDLGVVNTINGKWDVLDYAWEPSASPVPNSLGALSKRRAESLMDSFLPGLRYPNRLNLFGVDPNDLPLSELRRPTTIYTDLHRAGRRWRSRVTVNQLDRATDISSYFQFNVSLAGHGGRVVADVSDVGDWTRVETIADAFGFATAALGRPIPTADLPGASVSRFGGVSGWTWSGSSTVQLNFHLPGTARHDTLVVSYGDDITFELGCGDGGTSEGADSIDIGGPEASIMSMPGMSQLIWPTDSAHARYSVNGPFSKRKLAEIARSMTD
jgi:hypothetical protein